MWNATLIGMPGKFPSVAPPLSERPRRNAQPLNSRKLFISQTQLFPDFASNRVCGQVPRNAHWSADWLSFMYEVPTRC